MKMPRFSSRKEASLPISEIAKSFARVFNSNDGDRVMKHLRSITFERCFGAEASEEILRFSEGQKALVAHIEALIKSGSGE